MPRLGFDGVSVQAELSQAESTLGRKAQVIMLPLDGEWATTPEQIAWLRAQGFSLGFYHANISASDVISGPANAKWHANSAIAAAQRLGIPTNVLIFCDIEASWTPTAEWLCAWADAMRAGPYAKAGGIYASPYAVHFQNAFAAARAANDNAALMPLWSADWKGSVVAPTSVPSWGPATCANAPVAVHQWWGLWIVDCNLIADDFDGLWEAPAIGEYSDVPSDSWEAPVIAEATKEGLMQGYGDGTFHPNDAPTRAELAEVAVNVLKAARTPVSLSGILPHPRLTGVLRSSPRPGLMHPSAWLGASSTTSDQRRALAAQVQVRDQSQTSECQAFTASELRQLWDLFLGLPSVEYDPQYIYGKGHVLAGASGEGMQPVWAWEVLKQLGALPLGDSPAFNPTENVQQAEALLTPAMDAEAEPHKITAYGPITLGGDGTVGGNAEVLAAAIDHFPISIAVPVAYSGQLFSPSADGRGGYVAQWAPGSQVEGGHAMWAYDYRAVTAYPGAKPEFQILCRNSWGTSYGQNGDVWLGGTYPLDEAWSITCVKPNPVCADLDAFLAWMKADVTEVLQRLKQTFLNGGADDATATAKAQSAYDAQVQAIQAQMKTQGC